MRPRLHGGVYAILDVRAPSPDAGTDLGEGGSMSGVIDAGDVEAVTESLLEGGVKNIQLRAKTLDARAFLSLARRMRRLTERAGVMLIINDRPDIAVLSEADGVHLGQTDLDAADVRPWIRPSQIIGVSCHGLEQAHAAADSQVVDYIGFGPVYPTLSKKDPDPVIGVGALQSVAVALPNVDVVAIGGITIDRLREIQRAGARCAAMISALLAADSVRERAAAAVTAWNTPEP
jgi:thiamine-phosphate pyrophosphorylase